MSNTASVGGGGGTATSRTRIVTVLSAVAAVFVLSAANNTSKSVSCDTCCAFVITSVNPEIVNQLGALYPD